MLNEVLRLTRKNKKERARKEKLKAVKEFRLYNFKYNDKEK